MKSQFKNLFCAIVLILSLSVAVSAADKQKSQIISIKTSAICESCKARLEKTLKAIEGVEEAVLNLNNKKVKIKFDADKTDATKLREVIANVGYDADDVKKNTAAYEKLPMCCQKPMKE